MKQINAYSYQEQYLFDSLYKELFDKNKPFYAGHILARAAQRFPDAVAIIYKDRRYTYHELYKRASAFSNLLGQRGVKPRDRIVVCFENSPEFYIAYYAAWQMGAIVAPLNFFLHEAELEHIVADANPKIIIASTSIESIQKSLHKTGFPPVLTEQDMLQHDASYDLAALEPDEVSLLLYTSGTTGLPKGVMLSSRNIMTDIIQGIARIGLTSSEKVLAVLPLFHSFAQSTCVWGSFFLGCTVIVVPKIERRSIIEAISHNPTIYLGVPSLYGLLCMLPNVSLDAGKYFISGGDALPARIRSAFELIYRRKLCSGYGLTETSPLISAELEDIGGSTDNVGRPVIGVSISIRTEEGKELPLYHIGTLWVKGDNVMLGYHNAPDATAKVMQDGWFDTGDLAYVDVDGKIYITGRIKDLIIHKGFNIYPQEIENVILSHPMVLRVGVIGEPDDQSGENPVAYVQLKNAVKDLDEICESLKALCRHHLAAYKVPRIFVCSIEELALTATGKVDKKVLRKKHTQQKK
jgi:long-chain acyl-CoA synthetase